MADTEENNDKTSTDGELTIVQWCITCNDYLGSECFRRFHIVDATSAYSVIPDLGGSPAPGHRDVRYF